MKQYNVNNWIRISLMNLLIVSFLGVLMRYKIRFEFPYFDQKYLQYAHSHFAFAAWVSQMLMVLMISILQPVISVKRIKNYHVILIANLFCAFGMLFSFSVQGYGLFSIIFSTGTIINSFLFSFLYFRDSKLLIHPDNQLWFRGALFFNLISSLGTIALIYMMVNKKITQHEYLASIYWYLHFQYNGWFFFACVGLFINYVRPLLFSFPKTNFIFWLFAASCLPAYGLSTLWLKLPIWIYVIIVAGSFAQYFGWIHLLKILNKNRFIKTEKLKGFGKFLFSVVALALTIKLSLQLGSTIPSISKLAFGFRPIVIAYLHLVLLVFTSMFLITYVYVNGLLKTGKFTTAGILIFGTGVFLNELVLAVHGIASLSYIVVPKVNDMLLAISILIASGLLTLFLSQINIVSVKK